MAMHSKLGPAARSCHPHHMPFSGTKLNAGSSQRGLRQHRALAPQAVLPAVQPEDKWISRNLAPLQGASVPARQEQLKNSCWEALGTLRMPTTRMEDYRFTDISNLTSSSLQASSSDAVVDPQLLTSLAFDEASSSTVVVVNGKMRPDLSRTSGLPAGVYVGSIADAPDQAVAHLGAQSQSRGGPFAVINGAVAADTLCIVVPRGCTVSMPLHVLYIATGASGESRSSSAPRLLLLAGRGASVEVVEEFVSAAPSSARNFTCSLAEVELEEDSVVKHGYVQREGVNAVHFKVTLVRQSARSSYQLVEAAIGGALARHDVGVQQVGAETSTTLRHFLLCSSGQTHDLHTRLELNHPAGTANQLHKCIATHPDAKGIFDGNVKVNKAAQKTDAGQLSRNLLLVPKATVSVKPNLQIVADDVKCTHGCTVSDLSEEELFYFRARGIPANAARQALVYSFGAEVVQQLRYAQLTSRIQADVRAALDAVPLAVLATPAAAAAAAE